jgi:outer membrane PBP1 activator LpoA protein
MPMMTVSRKWMFAPVLLAALVGGCVTTPTGGPRTEQVSRSLQMQQAHALAVAAAGLSGAARKTNDEQIERLLAQLDNATLAREAATLPVGDPLYNYAGRALLVRGLPLPRPFDRSAWKFDAGNRPAADRDGYRPPVKLAVLLPLSGNLATAAAPVRDGLLAGYFGEARAKPEIQFYDTAPGVVGAYERAVAEGNDFVVGPLGRDEVNTIFSRDALPVPLLALNRGDTPPPAGNASFSLSPEDEGVAAAEWLLGRKATRVLVIGGEDDTQRRAVAALRERLGERGAAVTDVVGSGTADFTPFAQKNVDAVFLAVRGNTARGVMPKLALAGLGGKPVAATSQLLSGTGKATEDAALDGIAFPSEPWTTHGTRGLPAASTAAQALPNARGAAARLFAFGHDAWQLVAYLERLALSADGRIEGATGTLRIDGFGNVQRTPAWSTFRGGVAVPL